MNNTTIMEKFRIEELKNNYYIFLFTEKYLVEKNFNWLKLKIIGNILIGNGNLKIGNKDYPIELYFSPFFYDTIGRFDRIFIRDEKIKHNNKIHMYKDTSLCLYHPIIDTPFSQSIPLFKMIPWISEWCVHYEEWKKYGIWFGKEIKH